MSNIHLAITATAVVEAIEIERERCARIAEHCTLYVGEPHAKDMIRARSDIAAAIRALPKG